MPRAPRIEFAGAIYHVMNRGNQLAGVRKRMPAWLSRERVDGELGLGGSVGKRRHGFHEYLER